MDEDGEEVGGGRREGRGWPMMGVEGRPCLLPCCLVCGAVGSHGKPWYGVVKTSS